MLFVNGKVTHSSNQQVANNRSISFHHTIPRFKHTDAMCNHKKNGKIHLILSIDSHQQKFHSRESAELTRYVASFFVAFR